MTVNECSNDLKQRFLVYIYSSLTWTVKLHSLIRNQSDPSEGKKR